MENRVFASWSGGKDCCLALYRASLSGLDVRYLANTVTEDGQQSRSHGMSAGVIRAQAQAIGIPLRQWRASRENYEAEFIKMLRSLKHEGIEGGVFGDIDFNEHRQWIDRVCREAGITPHLPLWLESQDKLIREFVELGFEAIVVAAKAELFGDEILGQKIGSDFISRLEELGRTKNITPCGESGEYHSLVVDGPIFKKRLEVLETRKVLREGRRFLEVLSTAIKDK